jgi:hypothetical protein
MGYRIDYAVGRRTMLVRVSGCTRSDALAIGREIRREAKRASVEHLVIDVRGLVDRFGSLGTLVLAACRNRRVAVVDDDQDNALYRPFSEYAARRRNADLRYFPDAHAALAWIGD